MCNCVACVKTTVIWMGQDRCHGQFHFVADHVRLFLVSDLCLI